MHLSLCFGKFKEGLTTYNIQNIITDYKPNMISVNYYAKNNRLVLYLRDKETQKMDPFIITEEALNNPTNINLEKYDLFCLKYVDGG